MLQKMAAKYGDDASELVRLKIISPELKDSEKIYKSHCDKLFSLIAMPEQLLTWGLYVAGWRSAQHHAQINLYTSKMQGGSKFKDISISQEELESAARDILDNFVPKDMDEASSKIFRNLIGEREDWLNAVKSLKQSSLIQSWTGFESAAKNIWIASVNSLPMVLGHPAFNGLTDEPKDTGVNSKTIQVGIAAKFGFDLRNNLGTILSDKYDFTSVDGIKKAYQSSFQNIESLTHDLNKLPLYKLEKTRNLLVHRAGIIDDIYKRSTQCAQECNAELEISDSDLEEYISTSVSATIEIFKFADAYLASKLG